MYLLDSDSPIGTKLITRPCLLSPRCAHHAKRRFMRQREWGRFRFGLRSKRCSVRSSGLRHSPQFESLRHFPGYFLEHAALRSPLAIPNSRGGVATIDALREMGRLGSKIHSCKFLRMIHLAGGLLAIWRMLLSVFMLSNARPLILSPLELCIAIYATSERRWSRKEP